MAPRRGKREGSIAQRKDGRWQGLLTTGYRDGKRVRTTVYGLTYDEVSQKLDRVRRRVTDQRPIITRDQRLDRYLAYWRTDVAGPRVRANTARSYEATIRLHIVPVLGHLRLGALTPPELRRWLSTLAEGGASDATRQYARRVLTIALNDAIIDGLLETNAAALIGRRSGTSTRKKFAPKYLTLDQARILLAAEPTTQLGMLIATALPLGLRLGEALGLRWPNVDLEGGQLHVREQLQRLDQRWQFVAPKSEESRRTILLSATTIDQLRAHRTRQKAARLKAGAAWTDLQLVFTTRHGQPLAQRNVRRAFDALLARTGLPAMSPHALRHSAATLLLAQGVPERVVQRILGHSDARMTARYTHVLEELQHDAATRMDRLLRGE